MNAYTNAPSSDTTTGPCLPIEMPVVVGRWPSPAPSGYSDAKIISVLATSLSVSDASRKSGIPYRIARAVALKYGLFGHENGWRSKGSVIRDEAQAKRRASKDAAAAERDAAILAALQSSLSVSDAVRKIGCKPDHAHRVAKKHGLFGRENGWRRSASVSDDSIAVLRKLMRDTCVTQTEVGQRLGMTRQAVSLAFSTDPAKRVSQRFFDRIAEAAYDIAHERLAKSIVGYQEAEE